MTIKDRVKAMHDQGISWYEIGKRFGKRPSTVRSWVDEEFRLKLRERERTSRRDQRAFRERPEPNRIKVERDARKQLANLPKDTRDFTGVFCGDPLPGRSALDRRD